MAAESHSFRNTALMIFARYPVPGKVKTRLAATIGDERAAEFYRVCAEYVFHECLSLHDDVKRYIFYSETDERERMMQWAGSGFLYADQGTDDLGQRMSNAFAKVFNDGAQRVVIIGTDVPDISARLIKEAIRLLNNYDTVIGPSCDGGYYLLGLKQLHPEIFQNIKWGTEHVFTETVKRLTEKRLSIHQLPELADIDNENDLRAWHTSALQNHPLYNVVGSVLAHA